MIDLSVIRACGLRAGSTDGRVITHNIDHVPGNELQRQGEGTVEGDSATASAMDTTRRRASRWARSLVAVSGGEHPIRYDGL